MQGILVPKALADPTPKSAASPNQECPLTFKTKTTHPNNNINKSVGIQSGLAPPGRLSIKLKSSP